MRNDTDRAVADLGMIIGCDRAVEARPRALGYVRGHSKSEISVQCMKIREFRQERGYTQEPIFIDLDRIRDAGFSAILFLIAMYPFHRVVVPCLDQLSPDQQAWLAQIGGEVIELHGGGLVTRAADAP